ncbi:TetR/AcrR family transcriptional regulator [Amycolatopsis pigmentata]|uniref:TetR/AcrR family transcriptional regulator n=1 Tax=Amycolatopsis pigmentata TaxID=450801 RepID=A0ABW5FYC3_9PSEU
MARSRDFDEGETLVRVGEVFARFGYAGTSIDQLVQATGLKRGSLYQAFASKAGLFRNAFRHLVEAGEDPGVIADLVVVAYWERASADQTVRSVLDSAVSRLERLHDRPVAEIVFDRLSRRARNGQEQ